MSESTPGFASRVYAYISVITQTTPFGWNTVHLDRVLFDGLGEFDTALYRFRPKEAGYYLIMYNISYDCIAADAFFEGSIRLNSTTNIAVDGEYTTLAVGFGFLNSHVIYYLTPNDYIDLRFSSNSAPFNLIYGFINITYLSIHRLS